MYPRSYLKLILFENGKAEFLNWLNGLFVGLSQMQFRTSLDAIQNQLECLLAGWMFWAGLSLLITSAVEGLVLELLFIFIFF